jgi:tetratricopeptide (TPR) repeat protein
MTVNGGNLAPIDLTFQAALRQLQQEEWEPGLAALNGLLERSPHDPELRAFIEETQVRARIDQTEREDNWRLLWRRLLIWGARLVVLVAVVLAANWGWQSYSIVIQQQAIQAQQAVRAQAAAVVLAGKYADAQAYLRAGRLSEAQALLEEIASTDPNYAGVQVLLNEVKVRSTVDAQYNQAMQLVQQQNWAAALPILQQISASSPDYKDVAQQLANVEKELLLSDLAAKADVPFEAGRWSEAATAYEGVRAVDPTFQQALVEQRLFDCYVQAARAALVGRTDSLEAITTAEAYFRKALALRPQDPTIKGERELARLFLLSQDDFNTGRWTDVITGLESVYAADPNYAKGSARQTLYEAYVARGDASLAASAPDAALVDYQAAVKLAEGDPAAVLRLYEAYLRVGDVQADQKAYEAAVLIYRKAVVVGKLADRAAGNATMTAALEKGDAAAAAGNFSLAYEQYRLAVHGADATQATIVHVVQPGEYLILIATHYQSTVHAIVQANSFTNSRVITGQQLVIPVLP